jgi:hypothetical protein
MRSFIPKMGLIPRYSASDIKSFLGQKIPRSFAPLGFFIYILVLFLLISSVFGLSLGVSPKELVFKDCQREQQVVLMNANDEPIAYTLSSNNHEFSFDTFGTIKAQSFEKVLVNYNGYFRNRTASLDVLFSSQDTSNVLLNPSATIKMRVYDCAEDSNPLSENGSQNSSDSFIVNAWQEKEGMSLFLVVGFVLFLVFLVVFVILALLL